MGHYESLFNAPDLVATYCYESRGTLIAARSAFRHRRNLLSWTSCYDPDFRDYRLGKVLQYDILDHILTNDDVDEFDLGAGRYPWKFEWTRHFDTSYRLRVERTDLSQPPAERTSSAAHGPARPAPPTQETHQPEPSEERPRAEATRAEGTTLGHLARRAGVGRAYWSARRTWRDTRGHRAALKHSLRRAAHRLQGHEIWYVARPGAEIAYGEDALAQILSGRSHLVYLLGGVTPDQAAAVNRELKDAIAPSALAAAARTEVLAAARAVDVAPDHLVINPDAELTKPQRTALVRHVVAEHPNARHHVLRSDRAFAPLVRAEVRRINGLLQEHDPPPADLSLGAIGSAVAAAYRTWDPDRHRLAVFRATVSQLLAGGRPLEDQRHETVLEAFATTAGD